LSAAREGQEWRLGEARATIAFVAQVAGDKPAILLGDFNALPESEEIALLRQAGFIDAFAAAGAGDGITWDEERNANIRLQRRAHPDEIPEDPPNKRIDFVFVRGAGLTVRRAEVVLDRAVEGIVPSDHYGVLAEVALP
jgi:endonuclease/exonuclease/phosphatase family metal-dependent hydrolase